MHVAVRPLSCPRPLAGKAHSVYPAASDPDLIPTLVGLGVSELSMSPPSIPRAKKVISELP